MDCTEEVDDVKTTLTLDMPATGLASYVTCERAFIAPNAATQGTALCFAGSSAHAAQAAVAGVRVADLPGSPPRGAPV